MSHLRNKLRKNILLARKQSAQNQTFIYQLFQKTNFFLERKSLFKEFDPELIKECLALQYLSTQSPIVLDHSRSNMYLTIVISGGLLIRARESKEQYDYENPKKVKQFQEKYGFLRKSVNFRLKNSQQKKQNNTLGEQQRESQSQNVDRVSQMTQIDANKKVFNSFEQLGLTSFNKSQQSNQCIEDLMSRRIEYLYSQFDTVKSIKQEYTPCEADFFADSIEKGSNQSSSNSHTISGKTLRQLILIKTVPEKHSVSLTLVKSAMNPKLYQALMQHYQQKVRFLRSIPSLNEEILDDMVPHLVYKRYRFNESLFRTRVDRRSSNRLLDSLDCPDISSIEPSQYYATSNLPGFKRNQAKLTSLDNTYNTNNHSYYSNFQSKKDNNQSAIASFSDDEMVYFLKKGEVQFSLVNPNCVPLKTFRLYRLAAPQTFSQNLIDSDSHLTLVVDKSDCNFCATVISDSAELYAIPAQDYQTIFQELTVIDSSAKKPDEEMKILNQSILQEAQDFYELAFKKKDSGATKTELQRILSMPSLVKDVIATSSISTHQFNLHMIYNQHQKRHVLKKLLSSHSNNSNSSLYEYKPLLRKMPNMSKLQRATLEKRQREYEDVLSKTRRKHRILECYRDLVSKGMEPKVENEKTVLGYYSPNKFMSVLNGPRRTNSVNTIWDVLHRCR